MQRLLLALTALAVFWTGPLRAEPTKIRVGHGPAAEEQLWLMAADPAVTPNRGKAYDFELTVFRGTDTRFTAFLAGELDLATGSSHAVLFALEKGIDLVILGSVSRESSQGFVTEYLVAEDSPYKSIKDIKGATIGINAARSSIDFWARSALAKNGLDPNRDVKWAIVGFPNQGQALRKGQLNVGAFPQPFSANEHKQGGVRVLFTSKEAVPFDEDLQVLFARREFLQKNPDAVRAFMADFVKATKQYVERPEESRRALLKSGLVSIPEDVFLGMKDYDRALDARIEVSGLGQVQDLLIEQGFQKKKVDLARFIDTSFLPSK